MKKTSILLVFLFMASLTYVVKAGPGDPEITRKCTVSSNVNSNYGHCRPAADGVGDECYLEGTGPGCDGEKLVPV